MSSLERRGKNQTVQSFISGSDGKRSRLLAGAVGLGTFTYGSRGWLESVAVTLTPTPGDSHHGHLSPLSWRLEAGAIKEEYIL